MREEKYYYRTKMFQLFLERDLSVSTKSKISNFFNNIKEEEKEYLARKIILLIETSKTEKEIVEKLLFYRTE